MQTTHCDFDHRKRSEVLTPYTVSSNNAADVPMIRPYIIRNNMANTVVTLSERRKHPRISDAVALRLNSSETTDPLNPQPTHIVKMSCGGLRFVHNTAIDIGTRMNLSVHLPSSDQTIHLASRVISSGEEKSQLLSHSKQKQYFVQIEFVELSKTVLELLKRHIDHVIQKTGMTHRDVNRIA